MALTLIWSHNHNCSPFQINAIKLIRLTKTAIIALIINKHLVTISEAPLSGNWPQEIMELACFNFKAIP